MFTNHFVTGHNAVIEDLGNGIFGLVKGYSWWAGKITIENKTVEFGVLWGMVLVGLLKSPGKNQIDLSGVNRDKYRRLLKAYRVLKNLQGGLAW